MNLNGSLFYLNVFLTTKIKIFSVPTKTENAFLQNIRTHPRFNYFLILLDFPHNFNVFFHVQKNAKTLIFIYIIHSLLRNSCTKSYKTHCTFFYSAHLNLYIFNDILTTSLHNSTDTSIILHKKPWFFCKNKIFHLF